MDNIVYVWFDQKTLMMQDVEIIIPAQTVHY